VYWRRRNLPGSGGAQINVRAGLILRDTTAAGPRSVFWYALSVAAIAHSVLWFLSGHPWPYTVAASRTLHNISDRDAIIAVLLLVPGFLYTRLTLPDRHSITGYLGAAPRMAAQACIAIMAVMAAALATGVGGMALAVISFCTFVLSVASAITIILPDLVRWLAKRRHKERSTLEQLRAMRTPGWVNPGKNDVSPDVIFSWRSS
jgi:hypothetical protein